MQRKLRVHHLLCIPLFQGYGYSDSFSRNMEAQIEYLKAHADEKISLVCAPDMICERCPNLKDGKFCRESGDRVREKDRRLYESLGLEGECFTFRLLLQRAENAVTETVFLESCQDCEWRERGLCSWEKYRRRLKNMYI